MDAVLEFDFQNDVGYWVHIAAHRFERAMNAELNIEGITYRQCQVLAWLALEGNLSQVELAERMNVEPPTVVRVLDCMARDGLIARDPSETDRRRKIVRPLRKSVPLWKKIVACGDRVKKRAYQGMSAQERKTLRRLLERVHRNLNGNNCEK